MRGIKKMLTVFCLVLCFYATAQPIEETKLVWHTDLMKAQEISEAMGKPLFAFFTGSDWCPWCRKLQKDVFSKQEFLQWAEQNVVLVEVDFPRNKIQSLTLSEQNRALQQVFQVNGYPTVWIFFLHKNENNTDYEIEKLGSLGYPSGAESGKEEIKFLKEVMGFFRSRRIK